MFFKRENNADTADLMYSFTADYKSLDEIKTVELIENGRNIDVTDSNKHEFIK